MSKEEILEHYINGAETFTKHFKPSILAAMDQYAKEVAIGFFKWNAKQLNEYIAYTQKGQQYLGTSEYEQQMDFFEKATFEERYQLYLNHLQSIQV